MGRSGEIGLVAKWAVAYYLMLASARLAEFRVSSRGGALESTDLRLTP
jgi:hypothetical protein